MLSDKEDQDIIIKGVKLARKILASMPLAQFNDDEIFPGSERQTDEEILEYLREKANTVYHPVGTCKMGKDENAVVNDKLYAHGLENLRIVDASIMPNITSGNTNAPTIMIAEKGAEFILNNQTK